jgi:hypothetical protein
MKKIFNLTNVTYLMLILSIGVTIWAFISLLQDAVIHKYIGGIFYAFCAILNGLCVTMHLKTIKLTKQAKQLELNYKKELQ